MHAYDLELAVTQQLEAVDFGIVQLYHEVFNTSQWKNVIVHRNSGHIDFPKEEYRQDKLWQESTLPKVQINCAQLMKGYTLLSNCSFP